MVYLSIIGLYAFLILPGYLYLYIIERLDYKLGRFELNPSYAWVIFLVQALLLHYIYWIQ